MRGRDQFGNVSAWSDLAALTTSASGAAPSAPSRWIDLNDDGLADEITDAGSTWFDHVITEKSSVRVTYTQWVEHWSYIPSYTYTTGRYSDGFGQTYYVPGDWVTEWSDEDETVEIPVVLPEFSFVADPGYDYRVGRLTRRTNGVYIFGEIFSLDHGHTIDGINNWTPSDFWSETRYYGLPFVLVRTSSAPAGSILTLPGIGSVTANTTSGTITLGDGTTITAGAAGATVEVPGVGKIKIGMDGVLTVLTGSQPGVVTHTAGVASVGLPGGITVNPGTGEVTVAGPAGASVTVGGAGGLRVALPPGLTSIAGIIGKAVDTVGNLLGGGTDPNKTKVDNGDGTWRDLDDPALSTTPGTQNVRVGVTDSDSRAPKRANIFTISFTTNPPVVPRPKILLLLHGMNSNTATWDVFVNATFGATAVNSVNIRDRAFDPLNQTPTPNSLGVYCYRLQFGFFDSASTISGVGGVTAANSHVRDQTTPDYLTNPLHKCGDFESFTELGQEVDDAITLLLLRHPNAQIVLLGHSRGGLAARAFLQTQGTTPNKAAVIGLLTTGSPHLGSRMGRIYNWLTTHPDNAANSTDWDVVRFLLKTSYLGKAKPPLDVRRPVINDVADNTGALENLNISSAVANLPTIGINYGEIIYDGEDLGILSHGTLNYSVFSRGFSFDVGDQLSSAAKTFLLGTENNGSDRPTSYYHGDGLIPALNQRFTQLGGFAGTRIQHLTVAGGNIVHTDEPLQTPNLLAQLRLLAPNWFP